MNKLLSLYKKYEELILYAITGGFTTVVSFGTHFGSEHLLSVSAQTATIISWICSVTFAFFTNKSLVFKSKSVGGTDFIRQFFQFYAARLVSLGIEFLIISICVDKYGQFFAGLFGVSLKTNEFIFKIIAQVFILVSNYAFSKFVIFRKKKDIAAKENT